MHYEDIFSMVGGTPCVRVDSSKGGSRIFLKLEGTNPTGSIKDRACAFMIRAAVAEGRLSSGMVILDASSGNFACSLAMFAKTLGFSSAVTVSSKLTAAKRDFLQYMGTTIYQVGEFTIEGNRFCKQLCEEREGEYCFLDQLHNWNNPRAHFETTGPEILAEFGDLTMVVGSLGSGGTMTGIGEYMRSAAPHVRIVVVECESGNRIAGTGTFSDGDYVTPFIKKSRERGYFDQAIRVTEYQAAKSAERLAYQGIFCGLQTGGVLHAARIAASLQNSGGTVVCLSGDTGWKNLDKLIAGR